MTGWAGRSETHRDGTPSPSSESHAAPFYLLHTQVPAHTQHQPSREGPQGTDCRKSERGSERSGRNLDGKASGLEESAACRKTTKSPSHWLYCIRCSAWEFPSLSCSRVWSCDEFWPMKHGHKHTGRQK